jgi:peptidoglycan/LPS O-acetylase OafA/YrhL
VNNLSFNERLHGLEILRFISGVAVLIWHYQHFYMLNGAEVFVRENQPFYSIFWIFYDYGFFGVQIFWCLSGYIFTWKYNDSISNKKLTAHDFFWLRFSRLYPLHLLTLFIVAGMQAIYFIRNNTYFVYQDNSLYEFFLQLAMLTGWKFSSGVGFNAPIWSVSVEIFTYITFFLGLKYLSNTPWINIIIIALGVCALIFKIDSEIIKCLLFFYMGGLTCIIKSHLRNTRFEGLILFFIIIAVLFSPIFIYWFQLYKKPFFITLFLLTYIPALVWVCASTIYVSKWFVNLCELSGNITYSIYLIHFPTQLLIVSLMQIFKFNLSFYSDKFFVIYIMVTIFLSLASFLFFEKPLQNFIRVKTLSIHKNHKMKNG